MSDKVARVIASAYKHDNAVGDSDCCDFVDADNMSEAEGGGIVTAHLPTLYEHYTAGGISSGLSDAQQEFTLNGRNITLYSGAMHYFRIPPAMWPDRLRKARAAGLNAVETYVPWNLHEPQPGVFEWGDGSSGSDHSQFLNLTQFLQRAQEEDLLVIVRPGPYICSEWEFGGLPSWLLRETDMRIRTSDPKFMRHVTCYFNAVLSLLATLQFTRGGPVIAFQIENEYGSTRLGNQSTDKAYLQQLKQLMVDNEIVELLFTSDSPSYYGDAGAIPGVLQTANFQINPEKEFDKLKQLQPGKPFMAMEYWTGWFDHWSDKHHTRNINQYEDVLRRILKYPASVNMYMFHGGTNWGFLNGANILDTSTDNKGYVPDTTSYDYDAPLNEAGDYTDKYFKTRDLINQFNPVKTRLPTAPNLIPRVVYASATVTHRLSLQDLEHQVKDVVRSPTLLSMEQLPINNNTGQQYGYIVYRKSKLNIPANSILKISGRVCDTVMVLVNGALLSKQLESSSDLNGFGYWRTKDSTLNLGPKEYSDATLELVVENWGRNNFGKLGQFLQFKGLWQGPVSINGDTLTDWDIIPLEFRTKWMEGLTGWKSISPNSVTDLLGPALYKATFTVNDPKDTYLDMRAWKKGFAVINGFVLGRHAIIGPQLCLFLPGSFLKKGENEVFVFEHFQAATHISFVSDPVFTDILKTCPMEDIAH